MTASRPKDIPAEGPLRHRRPLPAQSEAAHAFHNRGAGAELALALEAKEQARAKLKLNVRAQERAITGGAHTWTWKPVVARFSKFAWVKGRSSSRCAQAALTSAVSPPLPRS